MTHLHSIRHLACLAVTLGALAHAQADETPVDLKPVKTHWRLTDETYRLPEGERMSMAGASMLFDVSERFRMGVASYGAVRGERGGFITLGVAGEWRHSLTEDWDVHGGLFVGAGGGRGGYTLAGGGLMLRADAGLSYALGSWGRAGVGVSHVSFPSGVVRSTQPYLMVEHSFHSLIESGWLRVARDERPGLSGAPGVREQEFAVVARSYDIADSAVQDDGLPQHPRMQLLGFEWLSYVDEHRFLKLEASGAMGGRSDGYMQIMAGAGYRWKVSPGLSLKLHGAIGAAGGGRVDTGGGVLLEGGVSVRQAITQRTGLELTLSEIGSPSQSFRAHSLGFKVTHQFGLPEVGEHGWSTGALSAFEPQHLRLRVSSQTYFEAAPNWRRTFQDTPVSNLGVQLDYFVTPNWFLSGQGLAAYEGKAGAYMIGLVGGGGRLSLGGPWFAEGEALVGAAGGGGLSVGGGVVGQFNASLGYQWSKAFSLMATAGHLVAPRGDLRAHVAGLSMAYQFTGLLAR
ncbi:MAG TPA: hypothetical protein VFW84_07665 [Aquabacterium sp.]|uniref:hypothetical protein n=1 Tax=Aquabacterium sp. TaxID=1872578 RepID=UPI002E354A68|nr:hypothetical protein [Aquabacterium sp.]HEX5372596.1 hypothetical protein [Aquabacterium sp.]